ncbi:MAG: hypothetical protein HY221_01520 [Candidatus Sungbacteria bacterium]|uniref:N-acetyltransferase domain-containing protein n=1 Tax=Candidatus Sungiibacteriota bacterium TaxID=2750080 RepID=A0A932QY55_9BACT|nr:hypothetical protein [Candidatus Sungbacteria bacterium]
MIGGVGYDVHNDRSKGFLLQMQMSLGGISSLLEQIGEEHQEGTRLTIRIPLAQSVDATLAWRLRAEWKRNAEISCEAMVSVGGRCGLGVIAYYGANCAGRRTPGDFCSREWVILEEACKRPPTSRKLLAEYRVNILRGQSEADIGRLAEIYDASFRSYSADLSAESIAQMARDNTIAVARAADGKIVAVAQAEVVSLLIGGYPWRLIELSETATDPVFRGRGLSQRCKGLLLEVLQGPDAIFYTESNAGHLPVLKSNHNLGFRPAGRLEQHCVLDSGDEEPAGRGTYANLFVFSLR